MSRNAAEWIRLRESQHAEGIVTTGELCTAYLRIAGEFSAAEVFSAMDKAFFVALLSMCRELPKENDFYIFHHSPAQSKMHYDGLCKIHAFAKQNDMWA
jgi:hypothetical protein